jgi:hypothetical protein
MHDGNEADHREDGKEGQHGWPPHAATRPGGYFRRHHETFARSQVGYRPIVRQALIGPP